MAGRTWQRGSVLVPVFRGLAFVALIAGVIGSLSAKTDDAIFTGIAASIGACVGLLATALALDLLLEIRNAVVAQAGASDASSQRAPPVASGGAKTR